MSKGHTFRRPVNLMGANGRVVLGIGFLLVLMLSLFFMKPDSAKIFAGSPDDKAVASPETNPMEFSNRSLITIRDNNIASPYPSIINVNTAARSVRKVVVNLRFLSHGNPDDVDVYLLAPDGQGTVLMSDAGGTAGINQLFIKFDQAAANPISDDGPLPPDTGASLTVRPANHESFNVDIFDPPGPGTDINFPANMNVFNGVNPNGEWKLLVVDDTGGGDNGLVEGGWDLILTLDDLTVNTTSDVIDASGCTAAHCSLREAINDTVAGGTIRFSPLFDTPQTINLQFQITPSGQQHGLVIEKSLTISGPGADLLSITTGGGDRVIRVNRFLTTVTLRGMTITGGSGVDTVTNAGRGGGILNEGSLTISRCAIRGNTADDAGGIYSVTSLTLSSSTVSDNTTTGTLSSGAAGVHAEVELNIFTSTISGNRNLNGTSNSAGGVYYGGGAFFNLPTIADSTITNNSVGGTGGPGGFFGVGSLRLRNTIVAANVNNATKPDVAGAMSSLGYNLIGNRGTVMAFTDASNQTGTAAQPLNPLLAALTNNGGRTLTHALRTGSPALDQGSNSTTVPTDQRGFLRPFNITSIVDRAGGDGTDVGAFEAQVLPINPTTSVSAPNVTTAGGTTYPFTVTYIDDTAIAVNTIDNNDIRVIGPGGIDSPTSFSVVNNNTNGSPRTATYVFIPPGNSWTPNDNGTYNIVMQANQVADTSGSFCRGRYHRQFSGQCHLRDTDADTADNTDTDSAAGMPRSPADRIGTICEWNPANGRLSLR